MRRVEGIKQPFRQADSAVGSAVDQEGNRYYKVQNSWDTNQVYKGFIYVSEAYFLAKTLNVTVNKAAIPEKIRKNLGL